MLDHTAHLGPERMRLEQRRRCATSACTLRVGAMVALRPAVAVVLLFRLLRPFAGHTHRDVPVVPIANRLVLETLPFFAPLSI